MNPFFKCIFNQSFSQTNRNKPLTVNCLPYQTFLSDGKEAELEIFLNQLGVNIIKQRRMNSALLFLSSGLQLRPVTFQFYHILHGPHMRCMMLMLHHRSSQPFHGLIILCLSFRILLKTI